MADQVTVLLRPKGSDTSKPFDPKHAERLLNYPGSVWERAPEKSKTDAKEKTEKPN